MPQCLVHFDSQGKDNWIPLALPYRQIKMVTDRKVLLIGDKRVDLYCLQTGDETKIISMMEDSDYSKVDIFEERHLICVTELS